MKKIIRNKSYNTEYDSVKVAQYKERTDGWAWESKTIYRKKSTGEYFEFRKWSEWNDGWDIVLVTEKYVKDVISHNKKGETHKFIALMGNFPYTRSRGYFWGVEKDDPWLYKENWKKHLEDQKAERKRQKEEYEKKLSEKKGDYGMIEITGVAKDGMKFKNFGKMVVSDERYGKVKAWKVNFRYVNNNFDKKDGDRWYRDKVYVVLEGGSKEQAKGVFDEILKGVETDYGQWDTFMKDGKLEFTSRNESMYQALHNRIKTYNKGMIEG